MIRVAPGQCGLRNDEVLRDNTADCARTSDRSIFVASL